MVNSVAECDLGKVFSNKKSSENCQFSLSFHYPCNSLLDSYISPGFIQFNLIYFNVKKVNISQILNC